jgi:hypothetical protein
LKNIPPQCSRPETGQKWYAAPLQCARLLESFVVNTVFQEHPKLCTGNLVLTRKVAAAVEHLDATSEQCHASRAHRDMWPLSRDSKQDVGVIFNKICEHCSALRGMVIADESPQLVISRKTRAVAAGGPLHRDTYSDDDIIYTVVVAVTPVTTSNGSVQLWPTADKSARWNKNVERTFLKGHEQWTWTGDRGAYLVFDSRTWHRAGRARHCDWDGTARIILQFVVHPPDYLLTYTDIIVDGHVERSKGSASTQ